MTSAFPPPYSLRPSFLCEASEEFKRLGSGANVILGGKVASLDCDDELPWADSGLIFLRERTVFTTLESWFPRDVFRFYLVDDRLTRGTSPMSDCFYISNDVSSSLMFISSCSALWMISSRLSSHYPWLVCKSGKSVNCDSDEASYLFKKRFS
jgi:hypothetical protein